MILDLKNAANQKISIIFIFLLIVSLASITSLALGVNALGAKVKQQAMVIAEKDKQLEDGKVKYTSLAARLHKEVKKVGALEEELKKYRRR
jgi:predicted Holliday junction resolvase-like endonuclease